MISLDPAQKDKVVSTGAFVRSDARRADVLVIGLGNPILGDDGIGWEVAKEVDAQIGRRAGIEIDCLSVGGLGLMERMLGYERVILVDSMETGTQPEGAVSAVRLEDLSHPTLGHSASAHDASLITALEAAKALGAATPRQVDIVAIEARRCHDFSQILSPSVAAAVPLATNKVLELLNG
jgi:hydrogenase maturation protease